MGIYEAPGSAFWLSVAKPSWEGMHLPSTDITYGQVAAGRLLFSDEKFIRSAEEPAKRHYFINFAIPTAILSLTDVPNMEGQGFANLPCLGSRSVLAGLYTKFADAVRAMDLHKVRKLMESALTIPMRLRVAPSYKQVCLDSITFSEDLFAAKTASSDHFLDFGDKVVSLFPSEPAFFSLAVKTIQDHAGKLGLTFHGSEIGTNAAKALLHVAPFVQQPAIRQAFNESRT